MEQRHRKTIAQRIHAKKRASQRYGVSVNKEAMRNIVAMIHNGNTEPICKKTTRITIHRLKYMDNIYVVAYDKIRKTIATFLPIDCVEVREYESECIKSA